MTAQELTTVSEIHEETKKNMRRELVEQLDATVLHLVNLDPDCVDDIRPRLAHISSDAQDYFNYRYNATQLASIDLRAAAGNGIRAMEILLHNPGIVPILLGALTPILAEKVQKMEIFEGVDLEAEANAHAEAETRRGPYRQQVYSAQTPFRR